MSVTTWVQDSAVIHWFAGAQFYALLWFHIEEGRYRALVGKLEGKRTLGRPRIEWEDNIRMNLKEVGQEYGMDSVGSGQGQVAGTCECGNEHSGSIKCGEFLD
jgi:hypothetical protein